MFPIQLQGVIQIKKLIVLFMCAVLALSMAACGAEKKEPAGTSQKTAAAEETAETSQETAAAEEETAGAMLGGQMQIANPFTDCETLEEAAKITGFSLKLPAEIEETAIRVMDGTMIEVICTGSGEELRFRKAAGSEDISGDYNTYDNVCELTAGEKNLAARGNENTFFTATWTDGEFTYAISSEKGLSQEELISLTSAIE